MTEAGQKVDKRGSEFLAAATDLGEYTKSLVDTLHVSLCLIQNFPEFAA
jgi:hypothetical protein